MDLQSWVVQSLKAHNRHLNCCRSTLEELVLDPLKEESRLMIVEETLLRMHEVKVNKKMI